MRKLAIFVMTIAIAYSEVFAVGALYARRPLSNETGTALWLKSYDATVTITDQIAVTHIDHVFKNESTNRLEGIFVFPLPVGAVVTELALWIDGKRVIGDVMEKDTARAVYENIVRKSIDPALLEYMGDNVFKLSVFPIEPNGAEMSERRIELTYAELLPFADERVTYTFFMKTANLSSKPVERASISGTIASQKNIISLGSPTHASGTLLSLRREDDRHYEIVYGNENAHSETDLQIQFRFQEDSFALNHLIYLPDQYYPMFFDAEGDDGYFLLWVTPPHNPDSLQRLPKNIALVADVSSSMSGSRIVQLRKSLNAMIDMLVDEDKFALIAFSTGVQAFSDDMVPATASNREAAHSFINELSEAGLTNYEDALNNALKSTWGKSSVNVLVFFTDGEPTWPVTSSKTKILSSVKENNTNDISFYTFGLGEEPDGKFLRSLAIQNGGEYQAISGESAITPVLSAFMKRISYPLVTALSLDYGTIGHYDVFPRPLPNLFAGTQLTVMGRFRTEGVSTVTFSGKQADNEVLLKRSLAFDDSQKDHPFVPRMWASAKIDYLLGEIALTGEQPELVNNVKMLGKKYSIITPYTSMLVTEPSTGIVEDKRTAKPASFCFTSESKPTFGMAELRYALPVLSSPQRVVLRIYDVRGQLVRTLVNEWTAGGNFSIAWDFRTDGGRVLAAGKYFAVLEYGKYRGITTISIIR